MNDLTLSPQAIDLKGKAAELSIWAKTHTTIDTQQDYDRGVGLMQEVKIAFNFLDGERKVKNAPHLSAIKEVNALYAQPLEFLKTAEDTIEKAVIVWKKEQTAKWEAEQQRLRLEQERKRQAEIDRLAKIAADERAAAAAEATRKAAEAKAESDRLAKAAEEARKAGQAEAARKAEEAQAEVDRLAKIEAEKARIRDDEIKFNMEATIAGVEARNTTGTKLAHPTFIQSHGESGRKNWKAEVTDMKLLLQEIVEGREDINLVEPNSKLLGSIARGSQGGMVIKGVRFFYEDSLAVRTKS